MKEQNIMVIGEAILEDDNGNSKEHLALFNRDGLVITYMELLEILEAVHEFYDTATDDAIQEYNRLRLNERNITGGEKCAQEQKRQSGYVYLINAGEFYKIGISRNINQRVTKLSTLPPFNITLVCIIKTDDMMGLEKELHETFSEKRVNGEWFTLSGEDVSYIIGLSLEAHHV